MAWKQQKELMKVKCPECKKSELEIYDADVNLDRNKVRMKLVCPDYSCPYSKILELGIDDIIGIGKSQE